MKSYLQGGLFVLLTLATIIPPVQAESLTIESSQTATATVTQSKLSPFNLVGMAYQGFFVEGGIPKSSGLICAYQCGRVNARNIVEAAIKSDRLPQAALSDESYLKAVNDHLQMLVD